VKDYNKQIKEIKQNKMREETNKGALQHKNKLFKKIIFIFILKKYPSDRGVHIHAHIHLLFDFIFLKKRIKKCVNYSRNCLSKS
jgi:hypothetical protein